VWIDVTGFSMISHESRRLLIVVFVSYSSPRSPSLSRRLTVDSLT